MFCPVSRKKTIISRRKAVALLLLSLVILATCLLGGNVVHSSPTTTKCTNTESEGCGLRGYIKDKQKEEDILSCSIAKISKGIEFLKQANDTKLLEQIAQREHQLRVKESARSMLSSEISILSAQCSTYLGENCDIPVECFGVPANSPNVCSGHGTCISSNNCLCFTSFSGSNCSNISTINDPILGRTFADGTTATSCYGYRYPTLPYAYNGEGSGLYQINVGPTIYTAYCDMESMGGGWTLIMKTSTSSPFVYDHAMWTANDLSFLGTQKLAFTNITANEDYISPLFYKLAGRESRLAMNSLENYNSWSHSYDTARNLIANNGMMKSYATNMSTSTCEPQTNCGTQPINKKPLGIWRSLPYDYKAAYWYRFGYVNALGEDSFGSKIRVGFSSDGDTSDTVDGRIGIGIDCLTMCGSYDGKPHGKGSGFYYYRYYNPLPMPIIGVMMGWLWIR